MASKEGGCETSGNVAQRQRAVAKEEGDDKEGVLRPSKTERRTIKSPPNSTKASLDGSSPSRSSASEVHPLVPAAAENPAADAPKQQGGSAGKCPKSPKKSRSLTDNTSPGAKVFDVLIKVGKLTSRYGVLPKAYLGVSRASNSQIARAYKINGEEAWICYKRITGRSPPRFPIASLKVSHTSLNDRLLLLEGLKVLDMGSAWTFNWNLRLPSTLESFTLGNEYNHPIALPDGVIEFSTGKEFNRPLKLSSGLKKLSLSRNGKFDYPLVMPPRVEKVDLGLLYNQPVTLSDSVRIAKFGTEYNKPVVWGRVYFNCSGFRNIQ